MLSRTCSRIFLPLSSAEDRPPPSDQNSYLAVLRSRSIFRVGGGGPPACPIAPPSVPPPCPASLTPVVFIPTCTGLPPASFPTATAAPPSASASFFAGLKPPLHHM